MTQQFYSWVYAQKNLNQLLNKYLHTNVHSSTIYHHQKMEITQMSIN